MTANTNPNATIYRKRVVAYARVSTLRQQQHDLSIPDQLKKIHAYAAKHGYEVVEEIVEAGSALDDEKRPKFRDMIERALAKPKPFDAIVVYTQSRFYRDPVPAEMHRRALEKNKVEILSTTQEYTNDTTGVMIRQVIGLMDQWSSNETAKHVRRTLLESARQGWWTAARPPFGYSIEVVEEVGKRKKRRLKEHPEQAAIVRLCFKLAVEDEMGLKRIADHLNAHGYRNRQGKIFYVNYVEYILKHEYYTGTYQHNAFNFKTKEPRPREEWIAIKIPPLISEETFQRAQVALHERAPAITAPRVTTSDVLLTAVARCGVCGARMKLAVGTSRNGTVHRYYKCAARLRAYNTNCNSSSQNTIREEQLDSIAVEVLANTMLTAERVQQIVSLVAERRSAGHASASENLTRLRQQFGRHTAAVKRLLEAVENGLVGDSDLFKERYQAALEQRAAVQRLIDSEERLIRDEIRPISEMEASEISARLRHRLLSAPVELRKRLLLSLIGEITVGPEVISVRGPEGALAETAQAAKEVGWEPLPPVHTSDREWWARQGLNL